MLLIRHATAHDVSRLPAIEHSAGQIFRSLPDLAWIADDDVQSEQRHLELIALGRQKGLALIAEDDTGQPVAFLNGEVAADGLHLWQMAVHPTVQRRRIGQRLLGRAADHAEALGLDALTLTTFRHVAWNAPYYQRLGFTLIAPAALNARLRAILEAEARAGLPASRRCAMCYKLKNRP
ncbi:MAG: GNAT family N-acetyltransferase [Xanthobacter sp.]